MLIARESLGMLIRFRTQAVRRQFVPHKLSLETLQFSPRRRPVLTALIYPTWPSMYSLLKFAISTNHFLGKK